MNIRDTIPLFYIFESLRLSIAEKRKWPFDPYDMYAEPNGSVFGEYRIAVHNNSKTYFLYPWQVIPLETFRATAFINSICCPEVNLDEKKILFNKTIQYWILNKWHKKGQVRNRFWDKDFSGEIKIDLLVVKIDLEQNSPYDQSSWEDSKTLLSTKVYYDAKNNNVIFN
ncbi:hypothetical protein ACN08X_08025 [Rothia sp. P6271]|uniref:hypothetical protein n=1 Tax=Rothia sp. P6271 TaxID=3402659 RepID=UPI003AD05B0E